MLEAFPSINEAEFREACTALEARCHDSLRNTKWLSVQWTGSALLIKQVLPKSTNKLEQVDCDDTVPIQFHQVLEDDVADEVSVTTRIWVSALMRQ